MKIVAASISCFLGIITSCSVKAFSSTTTCINRRTSTSTTRHDDGRPVVLFAGFVEGGGDKSPMSSPTAPSFGNAMNVNPGLLTDRNQIISEPPLVVVAPQTAAPLTTMGRDQKKKIDKRGTISKAPPPSTTTSNNNKNNNNNIGPVTMESNNWEDIMGPTSQYHPYVKQMNSGEEAASLDEIVYRQLERGVWVSSPQRDFNRGYNREFTTMYYM